MKKIIALLIVLVLILILISNLEIDEEDNEEEKLEMEEKIEAAISNWDGSETSYIELKDDSISLDGVGALVDRNSITILSAGTYVVSGTLADGAIMVDTNDDEPVTLILDGTSISCSDSAPIYIIDADEVEIILTDGTENYIEDGDSFIFEDS